MLVERVEHGAARPRDEHVEVERVEGHKERLARHGVERVERGVVRDAQHLGVGAREPALRPDGRGRDPVVVAKDGAVHGGGRAVLAPEDVVPVRARERRRHVGRAVGHLRAVAAHGADAGVARRRLLRRVRLALGRAQAHAAAAVERVRVGLAPRRAVARRGRPHVLVVDARRVGPVLVVAPVADRAKRRGPHGEQVLEVGRRVALVRREAQAHRAHEEVARAAVAVLVDVEREDRVGRARVGEGEAPQRRVHVARRHLVERVAAVAVDVVTFDGVVPDELAAANTAVPRTAEPPTV